MSVRSRIATWAASSVGAAPVLEEQRYSLGDWIHDAVQFSFGGNMYSVPVTVPPSQGEAIENNFAMYVSHVYKRNGPAFSTVQARLNLLTEIRFCFRNRKTKELFGTPALSLLEEPWPNGTTGELVARMEQDATLAGNFYARIVQGRLRRLSPDRVTIVLASTAGRPEDVNDLNSIVTGYMFHPDGDLTSGIVLVPEEVVHWSPIPDPAAMYRGMSWLTPVIREVQADSAATDAKQKFFENGMTPNLVVKFPPEIMTREQFEPLREAMEQSHAGADNAYKTLYLAAGADATVVGADLKSSGLRDVQGADETRICAAGRVPPVIVGLSEGLQAATYSNYGQARRQFSDGFARPQWRSMCAALAKVVDEPAGAELWYDHRDVAFLREDAKEAAEVVSTNSAAVVTLVNGGFTAESAVKAVQAGDLSFLEHSGLLSVQLQDPAVTGDLSDPPMVPATI